MSNDSKKISDLNPDEILKRIENMEPDEIQEAELDEIAGGHHQPEL
jgi:hypothetical protein